MTQEATEVPALRGATAQLVVPNAGDLTWATVTLDDRSVAAVPRVLASVPDAQARAVVWIALIDGICLGTVDPRVMVETFAAAWPHEDNSSILTRTLGSLLGRVIPTFLPPGEQDGAEQVVAQAAATLLGTAEPGGTAALVAARALARTTRDDELLHAWAAGKERPAGLDDDSDFGWLAVRNLAVARRRRALVRRARP